MRNAAWLRECNGWGRVGFLPDLTAVWQTRPATVMLSGPGTTEGSPGGVEASLRASVRHR